MLIYLSPKYISKYLKPRIFRHKGQNKLYLSEKVTLHKLWKIGLVMNGYKTRLNFQKI